MAQQSIVIEKLSKVYGADFQALDDINLSIDRGEIFALLGPNGAGKTTLINVLCGLVHVGAGRASIAGFDIEREFRQARARIGLVPQELTTDAFETVWATVSFSRGLFGRRRNPAHIEQVLKSLSLWDKRNSMLMTLSGGMKRRVMIAKALSHEPDVLFLDEPTAGVDVELRRSMWQVVRGLRDRGVTIVLTTHYLEEAEQMADRVGVINAGRIVRVAETEELMRTLGHKRLTLTLVEPLAGLPECLAAFDLALDDDGRRVHYAYNSKTTDDNVQPLINALAGAGVTIHDIDTHESSLEEIFVDMVRSNP